MKRLAAALTALVVVLGLFALPAAARVIGSVPYEPFQAPVPAGDRGVAWLDDARLEDSWTLWTARYDGKLRRVQRLGGGLDVAGDLAASASHVAIRVVVPGPGLPREPPLYEDVGTFAGRFGEPLKRVANCRFVGGSPALGVTAVPFQLRGRLLVFGRGDSCDDRVERDLAVGAGSDRAVARRGVFLVRAAGRFVAWLESDPSAPIGTGTAVVVQDRVTGQRVTRVPLDREYLLSLRDDGTLALSLGGKILIVEPGAVVPRELPIAVRDTGAPVPWIGRHLAVTSATRRRTLQLIDTNGTVVTRLVETVPDAFNATAINDTHVTWLSRGCRGVLINARPLTAPGTVRYRRDRYRCRLRRAGPTVLTTRRLHLGVSCRSLRLYCWAAVKVRIGRRLVAKGTVDSTYRQGKAARGVLHIRSWGQRLLRTRRSVRLRITARYEKTDSIRRATVRVRRR